jgi:hypothetical protein
MLDKSFRGIEVAPPRSMLKRARLLHLYLGLLLAPSLLFFCFSGVPQLFGLHETPTTPHWVAVMAQVHKKQNTEVRKETRPAPRPDQAKKPAAEPHENQLLKWYFAFMAFGVMTTTLIGIYMAFKYNRDRRLIWGLLAAGVVIPIAALLAG